MRAGIVALLLAPLLAAAAQAQPLLFAAYGDMPQRAEDEGRVASLIAAINGRGPAFTIFLGDAKSSREPCTEESLVERPRRLFDGVERALVAVPGDNDWADCVPRTPEEMGPAVALARLREAFFSGPTSFGRRPIRLARQGGRGGPFGEETENARWIRHGIVFATLNLPGVPRPDVPGVRQVHPEVLAILPRLAAAGAAWEEETFEEAVRARARAVVIAFQADLWHPCHMVARRDCRARPPASGGEAGTRLVRDLPFDIGAVLNGIAAGAATFRRPVLLLHADSDSYLVQPWPSDGHGGSIPYATRVMVPGGHDIRALLIEAQPEARLPWVIRPIAP